MIQILGLAGGGGAGEKDDADAFDDGWKAQGRYKGKKDEFKGHYAIYFERKNSFHLELNLVANVWPSVQ